MNKKMRSLSVCGAAMFLSLLVSSAFGYEKEIEQLSAQMAEKIAGKGKKTVAVVDFTDLEGNVTQLDQFIAEEFSVALAGAGKGFRVIDRTRLMSIIKENKLAATGLIDPATASKLGKIAGVDALVTGTLTPFGDNVRLTVKVLDADTAEVLDAAKSNFAKTQAVKELLEQKVLGPKIIEEDINKNDEINGNIEPGSNPDVNNTKRNGEEYVGQKIKEFTFSVKGCRNSGEFLVCSVYITSNNEDREISMSAHGNNRAVVLHDDIGNEYTASNINLGEQFDKYKVTRRLIAGVPTVASFEFKGIDQYASMVTLLEIKFFTKNAWFALDVRDIPILK
jgi:TolB-like protein